MRTAVSGGLLLVVVWVGCAAAPAGARDDEAFRCAPAASRSPALAAVRTTFAGNAQVPSAYLACALDAALAGTPAPGSEDGARELAALAEMHVRAAYYDLGYLTVEVATRRAAGALRFEVTEGARYRVGAVRVGEVDAGGAAVEPLGGRDALRAMVRAREGEWFRRDAVARDLAAIQRLYRDAGHALVEVTPRLDLHAEHATADLRVEVRRGPRVTVGRVELRGNARAPREALLAGFHPGEGEPFSETALDASRRRIAASRGVARVDVATQAMPGRDDQLVIVVEVQE